MASTDSYIQGTPLYINPLTAEKPIFMRMAEVANFPHLSTEQQQVYMRSLNRYRTFLATKDYDYNRGHEEGRAEGRAEGREEGKTIVAIQMKADGMPINLIVKYTGLTEKEINSL